MIIEFIANISKKEARYISIGSSSHDFYLKTNIDKLKKLFGMYGKSDPWKVKASWVLLFFVNKKLVPISIYDWKEYDTPLKKITDWHIGNHKEDNQEVALIINWINEQLRELK